MRPYVLCAAAACGLAFFAFGPTRADDKKADDKEYTIKAPSVLPKDKTIKVTEKTTRKEAVKFGDNDITKQKKVTFVYTEKTLDADEKEGTRKKFSRTYEEAKEVEGDESSKLPYHGRTIIATKSDGNWELSPDDKKDLDTDDLEVKELAERIKQSEKRQDALYPKKPVAVGGKWTMDSKEVAKLLSGPLVKVDPDSIKGEGKLVKVYKKGDKQWCTLEYTVTFEASIQLFKGIKGEVKATADQPLDGTPTQTKGTSKVKLSGKGEVDFNCAKIAYDLSAEITTDGEVTEAK